MEIESVWFWSWLGIGTSLNRIWDKIQIGGKSGPWFGRKRMGRFRWFRILPWSSGLSYFTRKRQTATSTNHWTTSRFVFSIHKFLGRISDFRKPLVFLFIQYRFLFTDMQILLFNFPFTHCFVHREDTMRWGGIFQRNSWGELIFFQRKSNKWTLERC